MKRPFKLGPVDKVSYPYSYGSEVDEAEIACFGFIVSGCKASCALELVKGAFNLISQGIDVVINRDRNLTPFPCGDHSNTATMLHIFTDAVGVISLIGNQNFWFRADRIHDQVIAFVIRHFAARYFCRYREPFGIGAEMNFCRKAAF